MSKFIETIKNKRYAISLLVTVLGLIGLISGTSYAILKGRTISNNEQIIKTGSVKLRLTENFNNIDEGVPTMTDVNGLLQETVYEFTVTNIGSVAAKYDLKLLNEAPSGQTALSDEYVRLGLEVNGQEMGPMGLTKVNNIIDSNTINEDEVIRYKLRVWFDNSKVSELTGNTNKAYLKLKIDAKQAEYKEYQPEPGATVLYSDGTLIINEPGSKRQKNITKHGAVSKEYPEMKSEGTDVEKYIFTSDSQQPWYDEGLSITTIEVGQKIYPTSTAYWFYYCRNMTTGDFTNLDTKNVTNMSSMFSNAGTNSEVTSFTLIGLNNWDTSKVTNMGEMFSSAGYSATTWSIGDLSNWDTSKVTDMSSMFSNAGCYASTFDIGNLSNWDTAKVTDMSYMFSYAGESATTWSSIGTLKVYATNIYRMFSHSSKAKATLNIYSNPASGNSGYNQAFQYAATASGALITVNYSSTTTNIDNIIATKTSASNVVKGSQLD